MAMKESDLQVAQDLKHRVSHLAPMIDFRVFGSRSRGDATWDSDLDIFIEFESIDACLKQSVKDAAWEVTLQSGVVVTTLLFSRNDLENTPLRSSPIVKVILEEGIPV